MDIRPNITRGYKGLKNNCFIALLFLHFILNIIYSTKYKDKINMKTRPNITRSYKDLK